MPRHVLTPEETKRRRHKVDILATAAQRDKFAAGLRSGAMSTRSIGKELGIDEGSVRRWHKSLPEDEIALMCARHYQAVRVEAVELAAEGIEQVGEDLDRDLRWIVSKIVAAIKACEAEGDPDRLLELSQLREMRHAIMDLGKLRGAFSQKIDVSVNLATSPQFLQLKTILLEVLERHPDAKADFINQMRVLHVIEHQQNEAG